MPHSSTEAGGNGPPDHVERRGCRVVDGALEPRRGHRALPACHCETPLSRVGQRFHNVTSRMPLRRARPDPWGTWVDDHPGLPGPGFLVAVATFLTVVGPQAQADPTAHAFAGLLPDTINGSAQVSGTLTINANPPGLDSNYLTEGRSDVSTTLNAGEQSDSADCGRSFSLHE